MIEKALLVSSVLALGVIGVQALVALTLKGSYRQMVDAATQAAGGPKQYEPYYVNQSSEITTDTKTDSTYQPGGVTKQLTHTVSATAAGAKEQAPNDLRADDDWH